MHVAILSAPGPAGTPTNCAALWPSASTPVECCRTKGLVARLDHAGRRVTGGLSSENAAILDADAVLARIIPDGSLEQIIFRVDVLHWIESAACR